MGILKKNKYEDRRQVVLEELRAVIDAMEGTVEKYKTLYTELLETENEDQAQEILDKYIEQSRREVASKIAKEISQEYGDSIFDSETSQG